MLEQEKVEDYIRSHKLSHTEWCDICQYYKLSESIMREYADEIEWYWVCCRQRLSEKFMREFPQKLWIMEVFKYQEITPAFADWLVAVDGEVDDHRMSSICNLLKNKWGIVFDKDLGRFRWMD